MAKHTPCDCKWAFNSTACNENQKWNIETCKFECKSYHECKKIIVGVLAHVFVRMTSI